MTELTKATQITKDRLHQWRKRNEQEGVACTPVVLINVIHGDKAGIILNIAPAPLSNILKMLQLAVIQVDNEIKRLNNGTLANPSDKP